MRKIKSVVISLFFICAAFAGVAKADAYLRGFQALEQKDYKTALYFLSLFAANGDARANYNLGIMYREGLGVDQDDIEALTHFIAAAEDGHMLGNYTVGLAFLRGRGSDVDGEAALSYLKEATLLGHALSPVEMGRIYFEGRLTKKDVVAAHFWWSVARDRNAPGATEYLHSLSRQMNETQKQEAALQQQRCKTQTLRQCLRSSDKFKRPQ